MYGHLTPTNTHTPSPAHTHKASWRKQKKKRKEKRGKDIKKNEQAACCLSVLFKVLQVAAEAHK